MEGCLKGAEEAIGTLDHLNSLSLGKGQLQTAVLLEHSHAHLFTHIYGCFHATIELSKSEVFTTCPYMEKFADS